MLNSPRLSDASTRLLPPGRRCPRLRVGRGGICLAAAAPSRHCVHGRSRRGYRRLRVEPVGVSGRDPRPPPQSPEHRQDFCAQSTRRPDPAQLHRVPRPARPTAHSLVGRGHHVQRGLPVRHGAHGDRHVRAGPARHARGSRAGVACRRRVRLVTHPGRSQHRTLQPRRCRTAPGLLAVFNARGSIASAPLRSTCRSLYGVGSLLRCLLRDLLPHDRRGLSGVTGRSRHSRRFARACALALDARSVDSRGERTCYGSAARSRRPLRRLRRFDERAGPLHTRARAHGSHRRAIDPRASTASRALDANPVVRRGARDGRRRAGVRRSAFPRALRSWPARTRWPLRQSSNLLAE